MSIPTSLFSFHWQGIIKADKLYISAINIQWPLITADFFFHRKHVNTASLVHASICHKSNFEVKQSDCATDIVHYREEWSMQLSHCFSGKV